MISPIAFIRNLLITGLTSAGCVTPKSELIEIFDRDHLYCGIKPDPINRQYFSMHFWHEGGVFEYSMQKNLIKNALEAMKLFDYDFLSTVGNKSYIKCFWEAARKLDFGVLILLLFGTRTIGSLKVSKPAQTDTWLILVQKRHEPRYMMKIGQYDSLQYYCQRADLEKFLDALENFVPKVEGHSRQDVITPQSRFF